MLVSIRSLPSILMVWIEPPLRTGPVVAAGRAVPDAAGRAGPGRAGPGAAGRAAGAWRGGTGCAAVPCAKAVPPAQADSRHAATSRTARVRIKRLPSSLKRHTRIAPRQPIQVYSWSKGYTCRLRWALGCYWVPAAKRSVKCGARTPPTRLSGRTCDCCTARAGLLRCPAVPQPAQRSRRIGCATRAPEPCVRPAAPVTAAAMKAH